MFARIDSSSSAAAAPVMPERFGSDSSSARAESVAVDWRVARVNCWRELMGTVGRNWTYHDGLITEVHKLPVELFFLKVQLDGEIGRGQLGLASHPIAKGKRG